MGVLGRCDSEFFWQQRRKSGRFLWDTRHDTAKTGPERNPTVLEAKASVAWRALMSRTYNTLTKYKSPHFKHLDIRQLICKMVSTFSHAAFHGFLSHFEQFLLSIHGEKGAGRNISTTTKEYRTLMEKLDDLFFNHLSNLTTLSNYFAAPELFVNNRVPWSELFTSFFSACAAQLCCFELVGSETPSPSEEQSVVEGNQVVRTTEKPFIGNVLNSRWHHNSTWRLNLEHWLNSEDCTTFWVERLLRKRIATWSVLWREVWNDLVNECIDGWPRMSDYRWKSRIQGEWDRCGKS